jgi:hypothetical protein
LIALVEGNLVPTESPPEVKFEIGHVLFIDIVGYSKLLIHEQSEQMQTLREIVRGAEQYARVAELNESVRLFEQLGDTVQN